MKAPTQTKRVDAPNTNNLRAKKTNKTTSGKPLCTTVANKIFLVQKEQSHLSLPRHPLEANFMACNRKLNEASVASNIESGTKASSKIKLQLFPADENTRIGLEKDGFCPYLELTISPQKKISSVLKHIMTKWGRSSIAIGEPKLLSCSTDKVHLTSTSQKVWSLDDSTVCAVDAFESLGRPSIFRLWYCWFAERQPYSSLSASLPAAGYSHQGNHDDCTDYFENTYATQTETKTTDVFHMKNVPEVAAPSEDNISGASNYHMDNDVKADCDEDKNLLLWYDNCTNISIGGLLSEASLQGKLNSNPDACMMLKQGTSSMSALAAPNVPSSHHTPSSILDGEDTCSSFSFRKLFPDDNDGPTIDDVVSKKSQTSSSTQVVAAQEAKTDVILCSDVYNDDRSLGLRSIKWTDSLGPFDLFVPSSRNLRSAGI